MPKRKDVLEKKLLLPINLRRVTRPFLNTLNSVTVKEQLFTWRKHWRQLSIFPGMGFPTTSYQRQTVRCLKRLQRNPRATSQTLQASVGMLNVHDSTIRLIRKGYRRKPLLSKNNLAAQVMFIKLCLNKPQDFRNNVLWAGCLFIMHSTITRETQAQHIST